MLEGLSMKHCAKLQRIKLNGTNLGEHELVLPDNIDDIFLDNVIVTGGLSMSQCTKLTRVNRQGINFGEHVSFCQHHQYVYGKCHLELRTLKKPLCKAT